MINTVKEMLMELVKNVPPELSAIILIFILILLVLAWLFREQSKDHMLEIEKMTDTLQTMNKTVNDFKSELTGTIGELKGTVETLIPIIVKSKE